MDIFSVTIHTSLETSCVRSCLVACPRENTMSSPNVVYVVLALAQTEYLPFICCIASCCSSHKGLCMCITVPIWICPARGAMKNIGRICYLIYWRVVHAGSYALCGRCFYFHRPMLASVSGRGAIYRYIKYSLLYISTCVQGLKAPQTGHPSMKYVKTVQNHINLDSFYRNTHIL